MWNVAWAAVSAKERPVRLARRPPRSGEDRSAVGQILVRNLPAMRAAWSVRALSGYEVALKQALSLRPLMGAPF